METKKKRTKVVVGMLALVGLLLVWTVATAGDLEPSGAPAPTMKTLDEIYDAAASVSEREGYMEHYVVDPCSSETFFTVPAGKQFVLMKLYFDQTYISLTVDDNLFISSEYFQETILYGGTHVDFPDRCITVDAGETLKAVNTYPTEVRKVTIVGYFYDVE
jgi:hypothetical protein